MQAAPYQNLFDAAHEQVSPELITRLWVLMRRPLSDGRGHEDVPGVIELLQYSKGA